VGENQAADVEEMLQSAGFRETDTRRDSQGIDRVVFGKM
jgi:methylase of polypeptide subunit release factors